ncbi:MAG TPA: hypothetical protein VIN08_08925 [Ohtaekwangia sp.]|uniref:hypothetical protein n=1 Tax=Ohtaekwangia sp. TaxID=2066019 RepID=UPI002F9458A1
MRKVFLLAVIFLSVTVAHAQEFGLSFSYFLPKNGSFSTPISPFSIRGLGFNINRFLALETGASLYRMSGLNIKDLPFESTKPLVGPNFTIFVPVELVIQLQGQNVEFDIKGGVFGFHGFDQKINYGNFDRAIRTYENWQVANSDLTFSNKPGWGYHYGAELTVYVTSQVGVSIETNYLMGASRFPLKGSYTGGNTTLETKQVDYAQAKIDFTGLEFSIGLIFNSGGGPSAPKKMKMKRRRR